MSFAEKELLNPQNSAIIFCDHQPQMAFGVTNIDCQLLKNNVVALAKTGSIFKVPIILSCIATESFSGYVWPELLDAARQQPIERTTMNAMENENFVKAVRQTGRKKLIMSGLWTEVCLALPALTAKAEGYEVYIVTDCSGGTTREAHDMGIQRMIQAGCCPVTWQQVLLEYQRDWANAETYDAVINIVTEHSGVYGMGVDYAYTMVHKAPQRAKFPQKI